MRREGARIPRLALGLAAGLSLAAPAVANADVCDAIPSLPMVPNPAKTACKGVKTVGGAVPKIVSNPGEAAKDIATAPFKAAGDAVMQGVTTWVAKGASWLVGQAGRLIGSTTTPRVGSAWFARQYRTMGQLAALFALPLLLMSILQGVVRRDGGVIARAAFVQLPLAFLCAAIAVTVVEVMLRLTDQMSSAVAGSVGSDAGRFFTDTGHALGKVMHATGGSSPIPLFAVFLGALIAAAGAFCVWLELLVRSAAIYAAVLFLPFTFVAMIWPATARWCRRLIEILIAIVLSKFVIVAIMALAAAGLGHSRGSEGFQGVLAGAALMMLAAFSPFVLLRLIPLAESAVIGAGWRRPMWGGSLVPLSASPAMAMRRAMHSNWGGGGGSHAGGSHGTPRSSNTASGMVGGTGQAAAPAVVSTARGVGGAARARATRLDEYASAGGDERTRGRGGDSRGTATAHDPPPARPEVPQPPESPPPRPRDHDGGLGRG